MQTVHVAVPVPLPQAFEYLPPNGSEGVEPGARVKVPFGRRRMVGIVLGQGRGRVEAKALKRIEAVLDGGALTAHQLELLQWCADYYCHPVGEVMAMGLPGALRRTKPFRPRTAKSSKHEIPPFACEGGLGGMPSASEEESPTCFARIPPNPPSEEGGSHCFSLNPEQRRAGAAILAARARFECLLLAGITGSGKTEVYLRAAKALLRRGRQVLLLLPEIGLTPQLVRRIQTRLGERAWLYHSGLSESERLDTWQRAGDGGARLIVGTRSAVFLPMKNPGLIVVDEEHDGAFKQADGARYSGRDVAVMRAKMLKIPVVLGSATPSLESLHNARTGRYRLLELPARAGGARLPAWRVLDMRGAGRKANGLSSRLIEAIGEHTGRGGQVLVFRNRRGYAPVLLCQACGWQADCRRCSAHLTWHRKRERLDCHHCGWSRPVPPACPECGSPKLQAVGAGTERLEQALEKLFPDVPVHRVDRDRMRAREAMQTLLETVGRGGPCILVGTQMLAKGHHLPGVTLSVVVDADQALFSADFRAPEHLGQTIMQVSGRAGRGDAPGEFILQTLHPDHGWLETLRCGDYLAYADSLLAERKAAGLPPWAALAMVRAQARRADDAAGFLKQARGLARDDGEVEIAGPFPSVLERQGGLWRFQLWLQGSTRPRLQRWLRPWLEKTRELPAARKVRWHVDIDPLDL